MEKSVEMKSVCVEEHAFAPERKSSRLGGHLVGGGFATVLLVQILLMWYLVQNSQHIQSLEVRIGVLERTCTSPTQVADGSSSLALATGREPVANENDQEKENNEENQEYPLIEADVSTKNLGNVGRHRLKRQSGKRRPTASPSGARTTVSEPHPHDSNSEHKCHNSAFQLNLNVRSLTDNEMQMLARNEIVDLGHGELTNMGYLVKKTWSESNNQNVYEYKAWERANWTSEYSKDFEYRPNDGHITVKKRGLYYIYSQILYHNTATRSSYIIKVDDQNFAKCMVSVDSVPTLPEDANPQDAARYKTCYTGGVKALNGGQRISIIDHYSRHVTTDKEANFFGVIRIA